MMNCLICNQEMANGLIEDVTVYKQEPKNLNPIDEFGDNGHHVYQLPIEEDA